MGTEGGIKVDPEFELESKIEFEDLPEHGEESIVKMLYLTLVCVKYSG